MRGTGAAAAVGRLPTVADVARDGFDGGVRRRWDPMSCARLYAFGTTADEKRIGPPVAVQNCTRDHNPGGDTPDKCDALHGLALVPGLLLRIWCEQAKCALLADARRQRHERRAAVPGWARLSRTG